MKLSNIRLPTDTIGVKNFSHMIVTVESMIDYLCEKLVLLQSITVRLLTDILKRKIILICAANTLSNDTLEALRQNRPFKDGNIVFNFIN